MAKCIQCGHDNDDSALQCVCGQALPDAAPVALPVVSPPPAGNSYLWGRIAFAVWALGFTPLFIAVRARVAEGALARCLIGAGAFWIVGLLALLLLGRDKRPGLNIWRIVFTVLSLLPVPLLLSIVDGIAAQGWPSGRMNRIAAQLLTLVLTVTLPALVAGLCSLVRVHLVAGVLAVVAGGNYIYSGWKLFQATSPVTNLRRPLTDVLNIVVVGARLLSFIAIPVGIVLIVGGALTFRAALKSRARLRIG